MLGMLQRSWLSLCFLGTARSTNPLQLSVSDNGGFTIETSSGEQWFKSAGVWLQKRQLILCSNHTTHSSTGNDALGDYNRTTSNWCFHTDTSPVLTTSVRVYDEPEEELLVAVFEQAFPQGLPSSPPGEPGSSTSNAGPAPPPTPPPASQCDMLPGTDLNGGDFDHVAAASPGECCALCAAEPKCLAFTFYTGPASRFAPEGNGTCCLKGRTYVRKDRQRNHTAGTCKGRAPPPAPKPAPKPPKVHFAGQTEAASGYPALAAGADAPPLNAFTYWGPSGMFNELSRLWAPGALANVPNDHTNKCGDAGNDKACDGMGPLVVYDGSYGNASSGRLSQRALVISAFDEPLVHQCALAGTGGEGSAGGERAGATGAMVACGLRGTLTAGGVPRGYSLSTIAVGGGRGVTAAVDAWGRRLLRRGGREWKREFGAVYARDPSLRYLSYWTDAGAAYYYATETGGNYEQTMKDVKSWMASSHIPTQVYQFDSWWYPKNKTFPGSPVTLWEPDPTIFPDGFDTPWFDKPTDAADPAAATAATAAPVFARSPLVLHNRAFAPGSAYAAMGNGSWLIEEPEHGLALPVAAALFEHIFSRAQRLGLRTYEQDWICLTHNKMAATQATTDGAKRWFVAMDAAAVARNVSIQLCMMFARHILQTAEMDAVTNARASTDYHPVSKLGCKLGEPNPTCTQWNIGLTSLFYWALGVAPSKDNFRTSTASSPPEPNPLLHTLVAGLSGGPVGPSDAIGAMEFSLVHHICRGPDGYLNKPTKPATPLDLAFHLGFDAAAKPGAGLDSLPTLWDAYSDVAGLRWHYLLSVGLAEPISVTAGDLNLTGAHIAFEYFPECWRNETAVLRGWCEFTKGSGHTVEFGDVQVNTTDTTTTTATASTPLVIGTGGVRGDALGNETNATPFRYIITAPVLPGTDGWVLLGETGKFFPATQDRFASLTVHGTGNSDGDGDGMGAGRDTGLGLVGGFSAAVRGAAGEGVDVKLLAPGAVRAAEPGGQIALTAVHCKLNAAGRATLACGRTTVVATVVAASSSCTCTPGD